MEMNPLKTVGGCLCDRVITNWHKHNPLTCGQRVSMHMQGDHCKSVQLGNTTTTTEKHLNKDRVQGSREREIVA